jgi:hypothetical protein
VSIYAVNGKTPISAWIPSRDDAGNGTTTLNDLVGSVNGTLTNFALTGPTSNWVSDTDNGGVRALDFDGANDGVFITGLTSDTNEYSFCMWAKSDKTAEDRDYLLDLGGFFIAWGTNTAGQLGWFDNNAWSSVGTAPNDGNWHHLAFVYIGGSSGTVYVDGSSVGTISGQAINLPAISGQPSIIGNERNFTSKRGFEGRLDDIRIFDSALDAADVGYLYNAGNGRGIVGVAGNAIDRRKRLLRMRGYR